MSITFEEQVKGRRRRTEFGRSMLRAVYHAYTTAKETEDQVEAEALAYFPTTTYGGRSFTAIEIDEQLADNIWRLTVEYDGKSSVDNEADSLYGMEWSTNGGGFKHVEVPKALISRFGRSTVKHGNIVAMNWRSHEIEGADVPDSLFEFSLFRRQSPTVITAEYVRLLEKMTGSINSAAFMGREPRCVLFKGASGSRRGLDLWSVTYYFAARAQRNITIPGLLNGEGAPLEILVAGWDFVWVDFTLTDTEEDDGTKRLVRAPIAAYQQRLHELEDFSQLIL